MDVYFLMETPYSNWMIWGNCHYLRKLFTSVMPGPNNHQALASPEIMAACTEAPKATTCGWGQGSQHFGRRFLEHGKYLLERWVGKL